MKLVVMTGLSGAGKSQALRALEDMGFYCVDNLPDAHPQHGKAVHGAWQFD